jgi:hypothetical protein
MNQCQPELPPAVIAAKQAAPDLGVELLREAAKDVVIDTEAEYQLCGVVLRTIASQRKRWLEGDAKTGWRGWNALVASAKLTYDALREARDVVVDQLDAARETYTAEMSRYLGTRDVLAAKAASLAAATADKYRQNAASFRSQGQDELAELNEAQAEMLEMSISAPPAPKLDGVGVSDDYDFEVVDMPAFLAAVLAGEVPLEGRVQGKTVRLIEVRLSVLKELRRSMGSNFIVPGVKVTERKAFRVRLAE